VTILIAVVVAFNVALLVALFFLLRYLQGIATLPIEIRGLSERIAAVERGQGAAGQNLTQATLALQSELSQARTGLVELQTQAKARADIDRTVAESVRRLETVIAGTYSKGAAGENVLDAVFAQLPQEWQVRNFRIGNRTVEFALRLPNNLLLPIDSKWPGSGLLETMVASDDPIERRRLKRQIEQVVLGKAGEVRKYLDPTLTVDFGVAAVPDAVYDLCSGIQGELFEQNVVLVAYSMFVPYLLLVFQMVLRTSQNLDLEKLESCLRSAEQSSHAIHRELEGSFSRGLNMLTNSRDRIRGHVSRITGSLAAVRIDSDDLPDLEDLELEREPALPLE
jgi:DNA recombination protein RmuC